jgi:hypothetical protein
MPPTFAQITLAEFAALLNRFPFTRKINAVHMHHTWIPNHSHYKGHDTIVGMWRFHTQHKGWDDIAQHLTVAPDGTLWLGRNWNAVPMSAKGHNGNESVGPFMFEMIGDFDKGKDLFEGEQREAALSLIALVQKRFDLKPETLRFHSQMSTKSCPGSAFDYDEIVEEVGKRHARALPSGKRGNASPFDDRGLYISQLADALRQRSSRTTPIDDELGENTMTVEDIHTYHSSGDSEARGELFGGVKLTPEMRAELRLHVINLDRGKLSGDGDYKTTKEDVDAIFDEGLKEALKQAEKADRPLRIVLHAHGGLVTEENGLWRAYKDFKWWQDNKVYPIYFAWETGLFQILGQLLSRSRQLAQEGTRDVWDVVADPALEWLARTLGGEKIWSAMKQNAERASAGDGGANYVAQKLKAFIEENETVKKNNGDKKIHLHAIGHSAGAIFHSYFLPLLVKGGLSVKSTHLLAPALRVDEFLERLAPPMKKGKLGEVSMFTMKKDLELADNCITLYHKSLLYLIYYALERDPQTPILGLEASLRANAETRSLFGLDGKPAQGEVIWSKTLSDSGRSASHATAHGSFNDDRPTMNSVLRRVLNYKDQDVIVGYPAPSSRSVRWEESLDWPEELNIHRPSTFAPPSREVSFQQPQSYATPPSSLKVSYGGSSSYNGSSNYRKRALCVGIDAYQGSARLYGCVNDAKLWQRTLQTLGFEVDLLEDHKAKRDSILAALEGLLRSSRAGDVVVFQYAGHGTKLPDLNGDELGGDTPNTDEALCPIDFADGAFLIDDDLAELFALVPDGVNVTCFMDCCHSGTNTRFAVGGPSTQGRSNERKRFIVVDETVIEKHVRDRETRRGRSSRTYRGPDGMREVVFAACQSDEVAWESDNQGDFTRRAIPVLASGFNSLSHETFMSRVVEAFGTSPRQRPHLDCSTPIRSRLLLHSFGEGVVEPVRANANLAQRLRHIADELERG